MYFIESYKHWIHNTSANILALGYCLATMCHTAGHNQLLSHDLLKWINHTCSPNQSLPFPSQNYRAHDYVAPLKKGIGQEISESRCLSSPVCHFWPITYFQKHEITISDTLLIYLKISKRTNLARDERIISRRAVSMSWFQTLFSKRLSHMLT